MTVTNDGEACFLCGHPLEVHWVGSCPDAPAILYHGPITREHDTYITRGSILDDHPMGYSWVRWWVPERRVDGRWVRVR